MPAERTTLALTPRRDVEPAPEPPYSRRVYLGIDPGPTESAWCRFDGEVIRGGKVPNEELLSWLRGRAQGDLLAVEMIASFGMAVGEEVFRTCVWIGRFIEAWGDRPHRLVTRLECKMHLCHDSRANDANIRQALLDRFGAKGTKKAPGRTFGLTGDLWSALAVAVTAWDGREGREP